MGWKDLANRVDDKGDDAPPWQTRYKCQICEKQAPAGPMANHVREKHKTKLEAADDGWTPSTDDPDADEAPTEPDPQHESEAEAEPGPEAGGRNLEDLRDQEPATAQVDKPQATTWSLPGGDDRPKPRRDAPEATDEDQETAPEKETSRGGLDDEPPAMDPAEAAPLVTSTVRVVSGRLENHGAQPLSQQEEDALVDAWSPVVAKYLPHYGAEVSAAVTTVAVFGPRVLEARQNARQDQDDATEDDLEDHTPTDHAGPDAEPDDADLDARKARFKEQLKA
ncbi:hypothetical protein BRD56_10460 [Thermoplasmatales archaeon SW_10_69_26]|nr:MAG: hypothetical protein BRD56_10460 [Thermoplasmatales archaeon SW_10_69_26]